jgi:hypothetical protein
MLGFAHILYRTNQVKARDLLEIYQQFFPNDSKRIENSGGKPPAWSRGS